MSEHREIETINVVVVGPFNPSIFQPFWLAQQGLIPSEEAAAANVDVVHPDLTRIKVGPFTLLVERTRAIFEIEDLGYLSPLQDLVSSIAQLLPHVHVTAIGFNRMMHFRASRDELNKLGFELAPRDPWTGLLDDSEVRVLTMWGKRTGVDARVQVQIEPSQRITGLAVAVNEEHRLKAESTLLQARDVIVAQMDGATANALRIGEELARRARIIK